LRNPGGECGVSAAICVDEKRWSPYSASWICRKSLFVVMNREWIWNNDQSPVSLQESARLELALIRSLRR